MVNTHYITLRFFLNKSRLLFSSRLPVPKDLIRLSQSNYMAASRGDFKHDSPLIKEKISHPDGQSSIILISYYSFSLVPLKAGLYWFSAAGLLMDYPFPNGAVSADWAL